VSFVDCGRLQWSDSSQMFDATQSVGRAHFVRHPIAEQMYGVQSCGSSIGELIVCIPSHTAPVIAAQTWLAGSQS
jgi:hypothetical protein